MTHRDAPRLRGGVRRPGAFSMLELAIVVGITTVTLTIALPTIVEVRRSVAGGSCLNNHKLIVRALQMYSRIERTVPYNYADYGPYRDDPDMNGRDNVRWALGCLSGYLGGDPTVADLRGRDEGEFPPAYVCPAADREAIFSANPDSKYHASYWTNVAVRLNRGWGSLFDTWYAPGKPPGWDGDSAGEARVTGRSCPRCRSWRSLYHPRLDTIRQPSKCVFTGDTNNEAHRIGASYTTYYTSPGDWRIRPGWGRVGGHLGFDRHAGSIMLGYVDGHAEALSWERLVAEFTLFAGSSQDMNTADPTGDFLILYPPTDVCIWPAGGFMERVHPLPDMIVE